MQGPIPTLNDPSPETSHCSSIIATLGPVDSSRGLASLFQLLQRKALRRPVIGVDVEPVPEDPAGLHSAPKSIYT